MMSYKFECMTQQHAEDIASNWHYQGVYSFYDIESDEEDLDEFLNPAKRGDSYFVVIKDHIVIGFFSFNQVTDSTIEIGLGMRPDLTGRGNGLEFLKAGIEFAIKKYCPENITLSVATFNERAIKVYKNFGFKEVNTFKQFTNGSNFTFLRMDYKVQGVQR